MIFDIEGLPIDLKNREKWVAIIGSRKATDDEKETAYNLGKICAKKGKIVVSGLAEGIDGAGHKGAIDGGGYTIALVSTPKNVPIYPESNRDLAEKIKEHGCIIYPYKTKAKFTKGGLTQSQQRLIERSVLNAYVCPNIVVVSDYNVPIVGGTKWATKFGMNIGHDVYRLDCNFKFHKNPKVANCQLTWIREMNIEAIIKEMDTITY